MTSRCPAEYQLPVVPSAREAEESAQLVTES